MKLSKLSKLLTVSALAVGVAYNIGPAFAAPAGDNVPYPMTATADVATAYDIVVTPLDFGTISVQEDGTDTATAVLTPAGVFTDDTSGAAQITNLLGDSAVATVTATQLPATTAVTVHYAGIADNTGLTDGSSTLELYLADNLGAPTVGTGGTNGSLIDGVETPGTATTDGSGNLTFAIGGSLVTNITDAYDSGTYTDSFTVAIDF